MKCPKCGSRIPEGRLYCEVCGKEISIVPEFDPEVENRINESLSDVAHNLKDESIFYTKRLDGKNIDKSDDKRASDKGDSLKTYTLPIFGGIVILILVVFFVVALIHSNKTTMGLEAKAEKYYVEGNIEKAIETTNEAISSLSEQETGKRETLLFKLYGYQKEAGLEDDAESTLYELTDEKTYDAETVEAATEQLVAFYEEQGKYDDIYALLSDMKSDFVKSKYSKYLPVSPVISPEGGDYEEAITVTISSESEGTVYYTVNGDDPTENSIKYSHELILEDDGEYVIKAVLVNDYGIYSEIVTEDFCLENTGPSEPVVMEDSGDYNQTTMIVVMCDPGCTIYYTNDGSEPNETSKMYTSPISMPIGSSTFKFVVVDEEGRYSEIVTRDYHLTYTTLVSVEQARQSIIAILVKLDILLDSQGKMRSEEGYFDYICDREIEITGSGNYYVFTERHFLNNGTFVDTGLLYAVNTHDGSVNRLGYDSSGNYTLITISNR